MRTRIATVVALICVVGNVVPAASDCYVVKRNGSKVKGVSLKAETDGTLKLQMERNGPTQTFKKGSYRFGYVPRPKEVVSLEKAIDADKHDLVLKHAPQLFDRYKYLGWGDYISYLEGMAYIAKKQFSQAKTSLERGSNFRAKHEEELLQGMVLALLGLKDIDRAKPMLTKMMKSADRGMAAFSFNARGDILVQEGKKKEAVLEYLKTLLLFQPGSVDRERDKARTQAVALLKELKDSRWQEIQKID
ncbi:MAG: tetratricopeptide repeat protein [Lentisphaerae bacterium]|jgi:tetratricopeptide (TPR) repeat protein|nr:tetratricopeptide repeat protein [Lentisphaerota bacterium]MBT4817303.1 tetratricopeptide repeat protein [Lentisphaerota bacterium]MBT5607736.1 tetratricopeptide repeat protein [Lentisphaerota bacterium]MBT7054899.1 tetratricopeptide repeat protein [Lentisphaerota bacterium]MBT7843331.1 tetratricopeptide repeat protein [Lentisphaerota bacterium]